MKKDIIYISIIGILVVVLLLKPSNKPKDNYTVIKDTVSQKILQKIDSLKYNSKIETSQTEDVQLLIKKVNQLNKNINKIDEKVTKDTVNISDYNDYESDSSLRARYGY